MVLSNHIAYRFLTDDKFTWEIIEHFHPNEIKVFTENGSDKDVLDKHREDAYKIYSTDKLINPEGNKTFMVTESVMENLDLLKLTKKGDHFDWMVFKHLTDRKVTFILPNNRLLRMLVDGPMIQFFYLTFDLIAGGKPGSGWTNWEIFFIDREENRLCEHFESDNMRKIEEHIYKFLCFFYLTDNQEVIIPPGQVHGTRKQGKIRNDFRFPVTIVNKNWNLTIIRNEGFSVSGHFRLQPYGPGRTMNKLIFIEPFEKSGYKRVAGKSNASVK